MENDTLEKTKDEAAKVLKESVVEKDGTLAFVATPQLADNYFAVWTRDAVATAAGALASNDDRLRQASIDTMSFIEQHVSKRRKSASIRRHVQPHKPQSRIHRMGPHRHPRLANVVRHRIPHAF